MKLKYGLSQELTNPAQISAKILGPKVLPENINIDPPI